MMIQSCQFLGFGTMNGKDGKPFKTREGGVMRSGDICFPDINDEMYRKITENRTVEEAEAKATAKVVGTFRSKIRRPFQSGFQGLYF